MLLCGKSCNCRKTLLGVFLLVMIAAGGGIILWQFLPQRQRENISSIVDDSSASFQSDDAPKPKYQFTRCTNTTRCCNGLTSNCDLKVHDVLFAGIHNANAATQDGYRIAPNHVYSLESSLDYGFRAIGLDIGKCDGVVLLVHGLCKLGTRNPYQVFYNINQWLDNNPNEILLISMEINSAAGGSTVLLSEIFEILKSVDGFTDKMWSKGALSEWPTLSELIEMKRRILFFTYNGENCYNPDVLCPPGFMDWFRYAAETEYSFTSVAQVNETSRSCGITRGRPLAPFFALNMFVTLPSLTAANDTLNTKEYVENHIEACAAKNNGREVNVIFIDFWHVGDLPEVVQLHNEKVAYSFLSNETNSTYGNTR